METLTIDWTSIILGLLTLLGGSAWFVNWRKDKQEAKGLRLDNQSKEYELAKRYVEDYTRTIVVPLQHRVDKMESKLDVLESAIQGVFDCPLNSDCPIVDRLAGKLASPTHQGARQSNHECCSALAGGELHKQSKYSQ